MVWQPVLASTLQYSCLEKPPDREAWQATVCRVTELDMIKATLCAETQDFLFLCGSSAPVRVEHEVSQLLGLWGPWQCQACRDMDCLRRRSYGPIRVFFRASCSRQSEGLFDQSFSVTPPVQTLRGLPCLGSFSVVWRIRHIEGHPDWGPALQFSVSGI